MSETFSFLETTVISPITYKKSKEENYKNIIPRITKENLNNKNILIPLKKDVLLNLDN